MIYKKILGTLVLTLFIVGASFATFNFVDAKFIDGGNKLNFDGLVTSVTPDFIILSTSGTELVKVSVNKKTDFVGKLKLKDIQVGDHLKINANTAKDEVKAKTVKLVSRGFGYGTTGGQVNIKDSTVTARDIDNETFTVDSGDAIMTFQVNVSTNFVKTSFAQIQVGDELHITGVDSGAGFIAKNVIKEK